MSDKENQNKEAEETTAPEEAAVEAGAEQTADATEDTPEAEETPEAVGSADASSKEAATMEEGVAAETTVDKTESDGETPSEAAEDSSDGGEEPEEPIEQTAVEKIQAEREIDAPKMAVSSEVAETLRAYTDPENLERIAAPNANVRTVHDPFRDKELEYIDYKDTETLKQYINNEGKILPRRMTGVSAKYQRQLTTAVKRARHVALLPFVADHVR